MSVEGHGTDLYDGMWVFEADGRPVAWSRDFWRLPAKLRGYVGARAGCCVYRTYYRPQCTVEAWTGSTMAQTGGTP